MPRLSRLARPARLAASLVLPALVACNEGLPTAPRNTQLEPGISVTLSGGQGSRTSYSIVVPAGTGKLRFLLAGYGGDPDLVVRFGAIPEVGLTDCVSESEVELEECVIDAPQEGTWYVMVVGYTAYNGAQLRADLLPQLGERTLTAGDTIAGLEGSSGDFEMFAIDVPAGLDSLAVDLVATGDPDLYLDFEQYPRLNAFECASFTETGTERCVVAAPAAGRWYVRVDAYLDFSAGTLVATSFAPAPPP